jgi:SH3 domain-containing kinase-binding protein 1
VECVVEFDYEAAEDDELTLKVGDVITDVVKQSGGWWEGVLRGKKGVFPDNFVKVSASLHSFYVISCVLSTRKLSSRRKKPGNPRNHPLVASHRAAMLLNLQLDSATTFKWALLLKQ